MSRARTLFRRARVAGGGGTPAPVNTVLPAITGTPTENQTLTASAGTWSNSPSSYAYRWLRDGSPISGATASTYNLVTADVGTDISVEVTASNAGGSASATSSTVGPIAAAGPVDYIVTTPAELTTAMNAAVAAGGGKVIQLADAGSFGSTILNVTSKTPTARVIIQSETPNGVMTPGFDFQGSANITLKNTRCHRLRNVTGTAADPTGGVVRVPAAGSVYVEGCEISSDPMTTIDFRGYMAVSGGSGTFIDGENVTTSSGGTGVYRASAPASSSTNFCITGASTIGNPLGGVFASVWQGKTLTGVTSGATRTIGAITSNGHYLVGVFSGTTACTDVRVTDCEIHDVKWGVALTGLGIQVEGNYIHDFYVSPFDFNSDMSGLRVLANRCWGGWAESTDGEPSGTNGPHSSVGGFSFGDTMPDDIILQGNIQDIGTARFDFMGEQAQGTGSKVNDMECTKTGSIAGDVLTITANGLLPTFKIRVGSRVFGTGVPAGAKVIALGTGTGLTGTYQLNVSATVASTTLYIQSRVTNMKYRNNLINTNASIGTQISYMGDGCEYAYNTHISTRDVQPELPDVGTKPSFYMSNLDSGVSVHDNVVMAMAVAGGGTDRGIHADVYRASPGNVTAIRTAASGPAAYEALFDGIGGSDPFSRSTVDNILTMFAPKTGGVIETGKGHTAYYDWDTHTASYPPFVAPTTSIATGVDLSAVTFDGANDNMTYTVSGAETLMDLTGNMLTFILGLRMKSGASDLMLARSANSDIQIRRLPNGTLSVSLKGSGGLTVNLTSTLTFTSADTDLTVVTVTLDIANYRYHIAKGTVPDNLALVDGWLGTPYTVTQNVMGLMSTDTGGSRVNGDVSFFLIHEGFLDLTDADVWDQLIALDGKPVDYGSDGSNLFGVQPKVYGKGNAAAFNDVAGLNLGSAARKFIMTGAVVDV